jgi:hypothetical protein
MAERKKDWTDNDWFAHEATLSAEEVDEDNWTTDFNNWMAKGLQTTNRWKYSWKQNYC